MLSADSRVPVELVFDQSIGHVFVNRVAGNIATTEIIASIEYGAAVLGTKVIMVLGHGNCGAVSATIDGKAVPGQISSLYRYIRPAINQAGGELKAATEANAKIQAQLLKESSPVLAGLIKDGKLSVVAAFYDVESGKVTLSIEASVWLPGDWRHCRDSRDELNPGAPRGRFRGVLLNSRPRCASGSLYNQVEGQSKHSAAAGLVG